MLSRSTPSFFRPSALRRVQPLLPGCFHHIPSFSTCEKSPVSTSETKGTVLPSHIKIEEEEAPDYDSRWFYPMKPKEVFKGRYSVISKLGWGGNSTIWLARDLEQSEGYVTLKMKNCEPADQDPADHELRVTRLITEKDPSHRGYPFVRTLIDDFQVKGPSGIHTCLVLQPMRETLRLLQRRCKNQSLLFDLARGYLGLLLQALDYLHSECHLVHTDLHANNILMTFEDPAVLKDFSQAQESNPMSRKIGEDRTIYLSHHDFGPFRSYGALPILGDFGLAQFSTKHRILAHPIQPDYFRAPEVILGTGWSYSADIWNIGVMMWSIIEDRDLFSQVHTSDGMYSGKAHLAEMIALLGPPPKELLERERACRNWKWKHEIENHLGELCRSPYQFFGGPFFTPEGNFMHNELIPTDVTLESSITSLGPEEKSRFLNFVRKMLQWLPEHRKTAKELLDDPFVNMQDYKK